MLDSVTQETLNSEIHRLCDLFSQGSVKEVLTQVNQLLKRFPDATALHIIAGDANTKLKRFDTAIENYTKAIDLKPDFAVSHFNLGVVFQDKGDFELAIRSYKVALEINPSYLEAHYNSGVCFSKIGLLQKSVSSFLQAIKLEPSHSASWNNIQFPLYVIESQKSFKLTDLRKDFELLQNKESRVNWGILKYSLSRGSSKAERTMNEAISKICQDQDLRIRNPSTLVNETNNTINETKRIFALFQTGRAGTGLLHSLIDGHTEVSTLPSIYFSEYFDSSIWKKITVGGWKKMATHFIDTYSVMFDASDPKPVLSIGGKLLSSVGKSEGLCNVGHGRNEVLTVDKSKFHAELSRLMNSHEFLDPMTFFGLIHDAYDRTVYNCSRRKIIFYHIHNPSVYSQLNLTRLTSNLNCILMVREPIQSCESWVKSSLITRNYENVLLPVVAMLLQIDNLIFAENRSIGLRLEDLKMVPEKTIKTLCCWMGIKEEKSLYEMTAQGKRWWGNYSGNNLETESTMPFDKSSIDREIGEVFSDRDQLILRTLFYPFRVSFNYCEVDEDGFLEDLQIIRPMLDQAFDFEENFLNENFSDPQKFKKSAAFLYIRRVLIDRWNLLSKAKTFPNMVNPMKIVNL